MNEDWKNIGSLNLNEIEQLLAIMHDSKLANSLDDHDPRTFILYDVIKQKEVFYRNDYLLAKNERRKD